MERTALSVAGIGAVVPILLAGCASGGTRAVDVNRLEAIVTPPQPTALERKAAETIQTYFERMYGVKPAIAPAGIAPSPAAGLLVRAQ